MPSFVDDSIRDDYIRRALGESPIHAFISLPGGGLVVQIDDANARNLHEQDDPALWNEVGQMFRDALGRFFRDET